MQYALFTPAHLWSVGIVVHHLPDGVEQGAVHPLHDGDGTFQQARLGGFAAADLLDFGFDLFDRTDGQAFAFDGFEQVLPAWIDGDAALGRDHVNQLARPGDGRDFVHDHRNAIAEGGDGENRASGEQAVLPAADAVQQSPVGVCDHVGVEVDVHFGRAQHAASTMEAKFPLP